MGPIFSQTSPKHFLRHLKILDLVFKLGHPLDILCNSLYPTVWLQCSLKLWASPRDPGKALWLWGTLTWRTAPLPQDGQHWEPHKEHSLAETVGPGVVGFDVCN